jgi:hypothetical protein
MISSESKELLIDLSPDLGREAEQIDRHRDAMDYHGNCPAVDDMAAQRYGTVSNLILRNCGPCSKPTPKLLAIDDFGASRGNKPIILFLHLAVAISVYVTHLSHHLINHYAACSH